MNKKKNYTLLEWSRTQAIQKEINCEAEKGFMHNKLFKTDLFRRPEALKFNANSYIYEDLLLCIECILKSKKIFYAPAPYYHTFKNRNPTSSGLSKIQQETGLETILLIIDFCVSLEELDVTKLKTRYASLNFNLLMKTYHQKIEEKEDIEKLKKNLYRFKLTELEGIKLRTRCFIAQRSTKFSYFIWKVQNKEKYSIVGM